MSEPTLSCPDCSTAYAPDDNYCRECGMYVAALRPLPIVRLNTVPMVVEERPRAQLPVPVKRAVTAVAIGAALQVGVGLAGRYLAAQAGKKAARAVLQPKRRSRRRPETVAQNTPADPLANVSAVSETVMVQRTWLRRE